LHDLISKKPLLSIETIWYARHCQTLDAGRPQAPKDGAWEHAQQSREEKIE
jgi:hypothetical protein